RMVKAAVGLAPAARAAGRRRQRASGARAAGVPGRQARGRQGHLRRELLACPPAQLDRPAHASPGRPVLRPVGGAAGVRARRRLRWEVVLMIFVTVGTTAFDALVRRMDELVPVLDEEVICQIGIGSYTPRQRASARLPP